MFRSFNVNNGCVSWKGCWGDLAACVCLFISPRLCRAFSGTFVSAVVLRSGKKVDLPTLWCLLWIFDGGLTRLDLSDVTKPLFWSRNERILIECLIASLVIHGCSKISCKVIRFFTSNSRILLSNCSRSLDIGLQNEMASLCFNLNILSRGDVFLPYKVCPCTSWYRITPNDQISILAVWVSPAITSGALTLLSAYHIFKGPAVNI